MHSVTGEAHTGRGKSLEGIMDAEIHCSPGWPAIAPLHVQCHHTPSFQPEALIEELPYCTMWAARVFSCSDVNLAHSNCVPQHLN